MTVKKEYAIIGAIVGIVLLYWLVKGVMLWRSLDEFGQTSKAAIQESKEFWGEYEKKSPSYWRGFAGECEELLAAYSAYTDYPYDIPVNDNPTVPDLILGTIPASLTAWGPAHLSITTNTIRSTNMGFMITCRQRAGKWNVFLEEATWRAIPSGRSKGDNKKRPRSR